jgi:hypothetical protein
VPTCTTPKSTDRHAEFSAQEFPPIYSPTPEFENENSPSSKQTGPFFRTEEDLVAAKDLHPTSIPSVSYKLVIHEILRMVGLYRILPLTVFGPGRICTAVLFAVAALRRISPIKRARLTGPCQARLTSPQRSSCLPCPPEMRRYGRNRQVVKQIPMGTEINGALLLGDKRRPV